MPPSTTPMPPGTAPTAPSAMTFGAGTGPCGPFCSDSAGRAMCISRSQFAVFMACQMPLKSGFPFASRGGWNAASCAASGRAIESQDGQRGRGEERLAAAQSFPYAQSLH